MYLPKFDKKNVLSIMHLKNAEEVECYYCYRPIFGKANNARVEGYRSHDEFCVEWHGNGERIFFHPECAEEFALHLIKDVRSGEDKKPFPEWMD